MFVYTCSSPSGDYTLRFTRDLVNSCDSSVLRVYVQKNTWNDAAYIGFSTWDYTPSDTGGNQAEFVWNEQERTVTVTGQKASGRQFSAVLT